MTLNLEGIHSLEAFFDGVLVGAAKRGVDKVTSPRASLVDGQLVAVFRGAFDFIQVTKINLGVNPLGEQVQSQRYQVNVSGALTVTKQAPFNAVGTRHIAKLRCRDSGSTVVVGVQAQNDVVPVVQVPRHPLNRVGIQVRGGHFHGRRQVDDHLALGRGLQNLEHLVTHLERKFQLSSGVALGRVFVINVGTRNE